MFNFIKSNQLTSAGDDLDILDLPVKDWLTVFYYLVDCEDTTTEITFNNDTGTNYARRKETNINGSWSTSSGSSRSNLDIISPGATNTNIWGMMQIANIADQIKLIDSQSVYYQTTPNVSIISTACKWVNTTDAITRIDFHNSGTGSFGADSFISVYGD